MKDEAGGQIILEFIGLRAKMYSLLMQSGKTKKTAKGVSGAYQKKRVSHKDYENVLNTLKSSSCITQRITSKNHNIFTVKQTKVCLSAYNDKRFFSNTNDDSFAFGHYKTRI